jgi:hypothetical protein
MLAQITVEGYAPGTLSYRTNNPGNVGNTGTTTRTYPTLAEGVQAQLGVVNAAILRKGSYSKVVSLLDYIKVYAPSTDPRNNPAEYVSTILGYFKKIGIIGFTADSSLQQIANYNQAINLV